MPQLRRFSVALNRRASNGSLVSQILQRLRRSPSLVATGAGLAVVAGSVAAYAVLYEPYWLELTRLELALPNLPSALDGLVIAHLSDFHLDRTADEMNPVLQAIAACNAARPDVVVLTGDYTTGRNCLPTLEKTLGRLDGRPVFAVLGNHDYRFGRTYRKELVATFERLGMTVLDNRSASIEHRGARLWFVGVGDGHTSHDRFGEAVLDLTENDRPRVLLTHYPDLVFDLPIDQIDLALAGHTHGAQIHVPLVTALALRHSDTIFVGGLYWPRGVPLYVNRGLGTSGYPIRLFARPELALLTLRVSAEVDAEDRRRG
jgi:predicted MPP superfamily phosphohydrolase